MNTYFKRKEKYILDFTDAKSLADIHRIIERELDFPEWYGANWDAFWDFATDLVSKDGLNIEVLGLDKIYGKFQKDIDIFIAILKRLKHNYNGKYADIINITVHHGKSKVELM